MAALSKTPSKTTPGKFRLTGFALTILSLAGLFAIILFFAIGTSIQGEEFSPTTFQVRTFAYRRIPGIKVRITKTVYGTPKSIVSTSILMHLPGTAPNGRWDVVTVSEAANIDERRATILVRSLESRGPNQARFWEEWSHHHPNLAKELWPIVQDAAIQEKYFCIPELLQVAREASTPDELATKGRQILDNSPGVIAE
jgi:hypothetical protein